MAIPQITQKFHSRRWLELLSRPVIRRPDSLTSPTYLQAILWGLVVLTGLGLMIITFPKYQVGAHFDDAIYIILSKSLLFAHKYGLMNYPGEPVTWQYPFGFPLLLSPLVKLFPGNLPVYKIISLVATLVNASLLFWGWRWLNRSLSYWWALAVTALHLLSPLTIDLTGRVMSEPVFLTFYLLLMVLAEVLIVKNSEQKRGGLLYALWPLWMGICLMMVMFTRTIGLVVCLSIIIYLFARLRSSFVKPFFLSMVCAALFLSIIVLASPVDWPDLLPTKYITDDQAALFIRFTKGASQQQQQPIPATPKMPALPETSPNQSLGNTIMNYFRWGIYDHFGHHIRYAVFPFAGNDREAALSARIGLPFLPKVIGFVFSLIVIYGYSRWFARHGLNSFNGSSVIYFISLFAWVWDDPRFLYPIQPQLLTALLLGAQGLFIMAVWLFQRINRPRTSQTEPTNAPARWLAALVIVIILLSLYKSLIISDSRVHIGNLADRTAWLRAHTPPDTIILSEYPVIDYIYSDRQTVEYPHKDSSKEQFFQDILRKNVDYILVAQRIYWMKPAYSPAYSQVISTWLPQLDELSRQRKLTLVYISPDTFNRVYQVMP